mgnify:CR=1 FL=1
MNIKTISDLYNDIQLTPNGIKRVKIDLHIHTPASHDFVFKPLDKESAYVNILDNALANSIQIIAITDHNTFAGYRYLKEIGFHLGKRQIFQIVSILCGGGGIVRATHDVNELYF